MSVSVLTLRFLSRDLRSRFAGSFSGGLWALLQPLLQLAITSFIFLYVFKARVPGSGAPNYIAFLAVAFWPWTAFSESLLRSTTAIQDNAALIGKVALPREVLVVAVVASSFAIHITGFVAVMIVLTAFGYGISLLHLPLALLLYVPLFALSLGCALLCAAVQVFVRDLVQALGQVLPLLMFTAPIYYARDLLPERFRDLIDLHPFTFYAESYRALLLDYGSFDYWRLGAALALCIVVLLAGHWVFRRLDPHFEDFL
ncbi:ABC transporter permease [Dokdonella sp.]|uniref:ABC transporter permease n=1 Tax=Dokdonella sp. TaxID=2291710 RepID=UPI001B0626AD|nr:ABC transporter permease [Dokdonella sp.]MBO9665103.1 ABC transporter permease [Dokdonella sp.]